MQESRKLNVAEILQQNMPWVILVLLCIVFSVFSNNFLSIRNLINIVNQNSYVIVASLGIAFIMMSGEIDLSVGYQMSLIGVTCGLMMQKAQLPAFVVIPAGILMGIGLNLLNALIAWKLKLSLLMVTVGTMTIFQGLSFEISQSNTIGSFPDSFKMLGQGYVGPMPFAIILSFILFFVMNFFLRKTYWGRNVYALGGNVEASRLAGIPVVGTKMMIAVISGTFVGLSTLMLISRLGTAQSVVGPGTEFTVITGILLGGVSIRGGEGRLSGVLAGILIMAVISNGMQLAGMGIYYQYIIKGIIMLLAIGFDVFQMNQRQKIKKRRQV